MYDKYLHADLFAAGNTKLPKHKGVLFTNSNSGATSTTVHVMKTGSGTTGAVSLQFAATSSTIIPVQIYAVPSFVGGLTAYLLN